MEDLKEMDENPSPNAENPEIEPSSIEPTGDQESEEHSSVEETFPSVDDVELPSNVTNRKRIFMPMDLKPDDPRIYGKWLWFSNGDISRQNQVWSQFANLIIQGLVILQESSTILSSHDRGRYQGVIKCYTAGKLEAIKKAGLAIQKIVGADVILHYKSNKASADSKKRSYGDRFISEYMLTAFGSLYDKDELNRWKKVKCSDGRNSSSCADPPNYPDPRSSITNIGAMPSEEWDKVRYYYPEHGYIGDLDGSWTLFCRINRDELDRVWDVAKSLVDDRVLSMVSCETLAADFCNRNCPLRRSVHCVLKDYSNIDRTVLPIDRLRTETNYDFPVYFKVCRMTRGKQMFSLKYLNTCDRELYEYLNENWQLVERGETLDAHR